MHRIVGGFLLLLLALPALRAADDPKDKPATPAEQYQALLKDFSKAQQEFFKGYSEAAAEDKPKLLKEKYPDFGPKFLELAEKNSKDPVALDALIWVASNPRNRFSSLGQKDESAAKALDLLLKNHLESDKLGAVCQGLGFNASDQSTRAFLSAVLEKSPHKVVQGEACVALAQGPLYRLSLIENMKKEPDAVQQFTKAYGKEYVEALQKDDAGKLLAEGEKFYREFIDKYSAGMTPQRLTDLCSSKAHDTNKASESLLRALLEKDTRPEVQGAACLFLGKLLFRRADDNPDADAKETAKLLKESEELLERASTKYADVELQRYGTVGKKAKTELFTLRNLTPGKTAPDIDAEDQDGKKFKLSDYRGKVVLLDFWSQH
jgi:AhpC/TSA family